MEDWLSDTYAFPTKWLDPEAVVLPSEQKASSNTIAASPKVRGQSPRQMFVGEAAEKVTDARAFPINAAAWIEALSVFPVCFLCPCRTIERCWIYASSQL